MRMRVGITLLVALLAVSAVVWMRAPSAGQPHVHTLSVRSALALCARSTRVSRRVRVVGYFRPGPVTNGPIALQSELFGIPSVPADAALPGSLYRGLPLSIANTAPAARNPELEKALQAIRPSTRVAVIGLLSCGYGFGGIAPTAPDDIVTVL